jgi:sarcosine oxidase
LNASLDVFVAGLGALGGAVTRALARSGLRVAACDAYRPPHDRGSSHGESRIIRAAYYEDPMYAPLARRAFELWRMLERETSSSLLRVTGGLNIGPRNSALIAGALASAHEHDILYEVLSADELMRRHPALQVPDDYVAVFEPEAGILDPEACVEAQLQSARAAGAELHFGEALVDWRRAGDGFDIETANSRYHAGALVIALGAWLPHFRPGIPLKVTRQPVFWFQTEDSASHGRGSLPHYLIEFEPDRIFYGFPDLGHGLKCSIHHEGEITRADAVDRSLRENELQQVRALMRQFLPRAGGALLRSSVCLYTNTPDCHFLMDRADDCAWILSACSGHGFKFAPAIGELFVNAIASSSPLPSVFSGKRFV